MTSLPRHGAMRRFPYIPLMAEVFESEAALLMTKRQFAIHMRLLWHAWKNGSIPENLAAIGTITQSTEEEIAEDWPALESQWRASDGRRRNEYVDRERERNETFYNERAKQARRAANVRWRSDKSNEACKSNAHALPEQCSAMPINPNPNPNPKVPEYPPTPLRGKRAARAVVDKPGDVSDQVWSDFVAHRTKLRTTVTATVLQQFAREADKAGISLEDAMTESCARGWRGFKAAWMQDNARGNGRNGHSNGFIGAVPKNPPPGYYTAREVVSDI